MGEPECPEENLVARKNLAGREPQGQNPSVDTCMPYILGEVCVDPGQRGLTRDGVLVPVEPRHMAVLECLVQRRGVTVNRHELLDAGWRGRDASDESLTEAISRLRRALGDDPKSPRYIQTIPKRGYRLIAAVRALPPAPARLDRDKATQKRFPGLKEMWSSLPRGPLQLAAVLLVAVASWHSLAGLLQLPDAADSFAALADPNPAWLDIDPDFF